MASFLKNFFISHFIFCSVKHQVGSLSPRKDQVKVTAITAMYCTGNSSHVNAVLSLAITAKLNCLHLYQFHFHQLYLLPPSQIAASVTHNITYNFRILIVSSLFITFHQVSNQMNYYWSFYLLIVN